MNEFIIKNGYRSQGNSEITGSLTVTAGITGSFTGSLFGSAATASFVNPLTQSVLITGSTTITGPLTATQIGAGAAPSGSIPLDVRAQGALSTDTAFRIRNSADTANLMDVRGNGNIGIGTTTDAGFKLDVSGSARFNVVTDTINNPYSFNQTVNNSVGWNQNPTLNVIRTYASGTVYQANGIFSVRENNLTGGWSLGSYFQGRGHVIRVVNIGTTGANLAGGYNHSCISLEAINGTGILGVFTPSTQGLYNNAFALFQNVANRAEGGRIYLGKNRGTGTAATLIQTNDEYGAISFGTDTSTNGGVFGVAGANIAAEILSRATAAPSGSNVSSNLIFRVKDNSTTFTDAVTINSTGNVLIGTTTDNGFRLNVSGSARITNSATITGSLNVTAGITGSLQGTSSFSTTSSYSLTSKLTNNAYFAQGILAADQVINPGTDVVIEFTDQFDPQGWYDPGTFQFTPTVEGYYRISLGVWFEQPNDNTIQLNVQIRSNGGNQEMIIQQPGTTASSGISFFGTKIMYFNGSTDYIDFTAFQGTASSIKIQQGSAAGSGTWFSAEYMTM